MERGRAQRIRYIEQAEANNTVCGGATGRSRCPGFHGGGRFAEGPKDKISAVDRS